MNLSSEKSEARGTSGGLDLTPPSAEDKLSNVSMSLRPSRPVLRWGKI